VNQLSDSDAQRDKRLMKMKYFVRYYSLLYLFNIIKSVFRTTKWSSYKMFGISKCAIVKYKIITININIAMLLYLIVNNTYSFLYSSVSWLKVYFRIFNNKHFMLKKIHFIRLQKPIDT